MCVYLHVCVCVLVFVCKRERERAEGEGRDVFVEELMKCVSIVVGRLFIFLRVSLNASYYIFKRMIHHPGE